MPLGCIGVPFLCCRWEMAVRHAPDTHLPPRSLGTFLCAGLKRVYQVPVLIFKYNNFCVGWFVSCLFSTFLIFFFTSDFSVSFRFSKTQLAGFVGPFLNTLSQTWPCNFITWRVCWAEFAGALRIRVCSEVAGDAGRRVCEKGRGFENHYRVFVFYSYLV